ncbi:MAG TPA: glycosyltransferase family 87 protein [Stellaceae bacterium]|nr:glycosyltransferase family 87 protein [Stellaceae bacterium]
MRRIQIPLVIVAVAAIAAIYGWAVVATTPAHPGAIGLNLNALGVEWTVFYTGARWFFDGHLGALFDGARFTAHLNSTFAGLLSHPSPFRPWVYPPSYLLLVLPFGLLPFVASYLIFELATAALLGAALWFDADRPNSRTFVIAASLLGPAASMNFGIGENAFLIGALLVGGFRVLPVRPVLGGVILSVLAIKPQFWIMAPVALIAARQWRALVWSIVAAAALAAASAAVFGLGLWWQWLHLALVGYWQANATWVEAARIWGTSVYASLIAIGLPGRFANAGQAAATLLAAGLTYLAFRRPVSNDRKIAVLLACVILAAPHSSINDLILLSIAAALWSAEAIEDGAPLAQWTLALAMWLAMLFNPPLVSPAGRLTPLLILMFVGMLLTRAGRRAHPALGAAAVPHPPGELAAEK